MIDDKAVGLALRRARKAAKLTQAGLGDYLGVSYQQIQKYESGTNRLSLVMWLKASVLLRLPGAPAIAAWINAVNQ